MEEVISSSLKGFVFEKNLNSWRSESKYESLGKSFYSLSFNFQKLSNFTQSITQQSNNQSIYLFIITFQNLEFWDVTLHHAFILIFIALWAIISLYVTILMAILSYFTRFT